MSNIYNNNKASNAKIGQNVNRAVNFFARFFRVNLVVCFDYILPKYTSALLFTGINPSSERHRELFVGCWSLLTSMGGRSHCNCPGLNNLHTKIPLKIYAILYKTNTYIFALRKTTTTQLIVNNIFISILFDFRMQFVQPGTPRTSDIESRISYLESRITLLGFRKLQITLLESSNLFDWDISTVTRNICFFHCTQNKTCTFEKKPGGLVHSTKQWREQK